MSKGKLQYTILSWQTSDGEPVEVEVEAIPSRTKRLIVHKEVRRVNAAGRVTYGARWVVTTRDGECGLPFWIRARKAPTEFMEYLDALPSPDWDRYADAAERARAEGSQASVVQALGPFAAAILRAKEAFRSVLCVEVQDEQQWQRALRRLPSADEAMR